MPCWYYEKEELLRTPSVLDGIEHKVEDRYRSEGARFIFDLSIKLRLRYDTCATAIVFFHRFYMFHSFNAFPRHVSRFCYCNAMLLSAILFTSIACISYALPLCNPICRESI